ncbi:MAG: DUF2877 domain-containing protein [Candidatus Cloacimonetes bacterium]|nr:DUF2877 domain-containing protein [Candidatus Cloacimonadota bacterium]
MTKHILFPNQIELLSVGDRISEGIFKVHSRFNRVINFENNSKLVYLVNKDIGAGPINIVIEGFNFQKIISLAINGESIFINNIKLMVKENIKYNSKIFFKDINIQKFRTNLNILESSLLCLFPQKSLAFLIEKKREINFSSGFEREFVKKIKAGVNEIHNGNLIKGIKMFKGSGFGFTPSGDDFITGLLLALYINQEINSKDLSRTRNMVYEAAIGNNLISNTFLYFAKEGLFFERFKNFVLSLLYEGENRIYEYTRTLLTIGETSGADMLIGFLFTLKKEDEVWL